MQGLMVVGLTVEEILNVDIKCVKGTGAQNIGQGHRVKIPAESVHLQGLTNQKKIHLPTGQVNFFFTCPAQIPTCPGFVWLKFLYAQDLQTEIEVPFLTLR